ncbi:MAG: ATP-dependent RNA helicase HrpA [Acidimicrobiales bacterium]|nr:ATP-dependent RNA helicase HrpA [Acidimicrobiales bacterium]
MTPSIADLRARLRALTAHDERRLGRRLDRLVRPGDGPPDAALQELAREVEAAEQRLARRLASVPALAYPAALPITERRDELLSAIRDHPVVVVAGETGSGKSTQLPKLCLEAGRGVRGMVGHTQPRRLAARAIATRVAEEIGAELGTTVGYTVRFTDRASEATLVKVMTDGILLAETQRDRLLARYDTLILDEAHERSLNVDFLLGYVKQLLPRRPDLKVIITSATIDTERFAEHFGGAPVIEVSGRTYPVEVRYRPYGIDPGDDRDQTLAICDAVVELAGEGPGDVLVFLSGEREIHDTAGALRRLDLAGTEILPLYARLPSAEQQRIFQPHAGRRVVLATNVAETSLTVPGIRYVVDAGTARVSRYSRRLRVQRLPIEPISQASADQRAGRCGRVAPGICIRLYAEDDLAARPPFTEPEILRTNLASVILQMAALDLGEIAAFPFLDAPDARAVKDGVALLEELDAFDPGAQGTRHRLTTLGRRLAQLPLDPRLGRMVLEAERTGCVREVIVIAAALSIQDPRERPATAAAAADELHARFADEGSDFLSFLRLWDHLRAQQQALSANQFRKMCRAEHLNHLRVREWQDITSQLRQVVAAMGIHGGRVPAEPDQIHRALLAGLLSHIGMREGTTREYRGARDARFVIARGSVLARKPPRWVMAAELVETNRLWARTTARIRPEWAEPLAGHLLRRTYGEPRWDARRGAAMVTEKASLYGLPIVAGRPVPLARVDPAGARELFIRHALVDGDWEAPHPFLRHNRQLLDEVRSLVERTRRPDLVVDDEALAAFYAERIPADAVSGRQFDAWWKRRRAADPDLLTLTRDQLLDPQAGAAAAADFPDRWRQGDLELALTYELDPGSPTDGVTVHVPVAVLDRVGAAGFDWQVPGLRRELVTALLRSLPKPLRRHVSPVADHARAFLAATSPDDGPLLEALARSVAREAATPVPPDSFALDRVPDHLRVSFSVEDDAGRVLAVGKDLDQLQARLRARVREAIAESAADVERTDLRAWTIGTLPRTVETARSGHTVRGYPSLVDEGDHVAVLVLASRADQDRAMPAGTRRLLLLTLPSPRKALAGAVTNELALAMARVGLHGGGQLLDDCAACAVDELVAAHGGPAWDEEGFRALQAALRHRVTPAALAVLDDVGRIVVAWAAIEARLERLTAPSVQASVADVRAHLGRLVHPGFVTATGASRLPDVARYLQAIERRLDRLAGDVARDQQRMRSARSLEQAYQQCRAALPADRRADAEHVRWMLEELRVSLFAQVLGTAFPVSEQRVRRELDRITAAG